VEALIQRVVGLASGVQDHGVTTCTACAAAAKAVAARAAAAATL
jgi:hypothetical protein